MRSILLLLSGCGLLATAVAQEITFDARVDRNSFNVGESIRFTLTLSNAPGGSAFGTPDLGGLVVVQGPFENSSYNFINGRMSSSISRTWMLTATQPGEYTIGAAQARVGGGLIATEPIKVRVEKGSASTQDRTLVDGQNRDRDLFVTISLNKDKVRVGEQIVATYTLFSRYPNLELSNYDMPALNGFWAEEIDLGETSWEDQLRTVNGLSYRVAVLKKQLLFPQRSGTLRIDPLRITCMVNRSFFSRGARVEARSNAVEIKVSELPGDKPPGFSGAVGSLDLTAGVDRTTVAANEAVELSIKLSGRTNFKLLDAPKVDLPPDVEVYDPKVIDKVSVSGNGMSGSREYQYLIIPRHEGDFSFGPFTYTFFDVEKGSYRTLSAGPFHVHVEGGVATPQAGLSKPSRSDVRVLDQDIRYLRTGDPGLRPKGHLLYGSWPYMAGMSAPALALILFLVWHRKRQAERADGVGRRRREADRVAKGRLKAARIAMEKGDQQGFHHALAKAIEGYLADRFGLGLTTMDEAGIRSMLGDRTDADALAHEAADLIATCDMARFAPLGSAPSESLYQRATTLISRIENA